MNKYIHELFGEAGNLSMLRVMSLIVTLTACYIAIYRGPEEVGVISVLLGTSFAGKVAQKALEVKKQQKDESA